MNKQRGLGRGLSVLIPDADTIGIQEEARAAGVMAVRTEKIKPNNKQPRKKFDREKIKELSASILEHGVIQPLIVTKDGEDSYQIVAGERRYRACVMAGLKEIPVIVKEFTEVEIMEVALIENLQREDLNPMEEALAYENLKNEFKMTQEEISKRIGKSRSAVTNTLRLLALPDSVQKLLSEGSLSAGHARAVLSVKLQDREAFAQHIVANELSVREAEKQAKHFKVKEENTADKTQDEPSEEPDYGIYLKDISDELQTVLGTKVHISHKKGKGKIEIQYYSNEDLERVLQILRHQS